MPKQIISIHGGNTFDSHKDYLSDLKNKQFDLDSLKQKDWKSSLQENLGPEYEVIAPRMPCAQNAKYTEWTIWFKKMTPLLNNNIILIGHSLGGIFLAKYLAENNLAKNISAVFLVAAPFVPGKEESLADFTLPPSLENISNQTKKIFLYYSQDDPIVPIENLKKYSEALPKAQVRILPDRQHFNQKDFPEIVADIVAV